ncbi:NAD(P)-binding domain-containing protein [Polyangium sp. 6x1]|nr:NAD(P)-binding domain-containing protein [Polyangium sp. 6x1]MDI1449272.1 NAD(P)-binding domain-containing protein [Polyangium sp. 6x1]
MTIGIIGAGDIGLAIAKRLARAGVHAVISNRRGPDSLTHVAWELGPTITVASREVAAQADIVFLAVNWEHHVEALSGLPPWRGRIVVDAMNPIIAPGLTVANLRGRTSSEVVAERVPGARVVKAFNTLTPAALEADPHVRGGRRVVVMSGDDAAAKAEIARLIHRLGFMPVDLGGLVDGGRLQEFPGGTFPALNLIELG